MVDAGAEVKMKEIGSLLLPTHIRELLWEDRSRTLRELITSYRLPLAVKLKSGDLAKYCPAVADHGANSQTMLQNTAGIPTVPVTFALGQDAPAGQNLAVTASPEVTVGKLEPDETILQIHEIRRKKIILARKMLWEKRQNDYIVSGELVEIPASLKGWLEVVPDDGRPVEYFDTIGGLTSIKCKKFLLRTNAVCHLLTHEENGSSCCIPFEVRPGEVLTTGIVYTDSQKGGKSSSQRNIFKRLLKQSKVKKDTELKYLQCFDSSGREIMVPFIVNGVFSPVGDSSTANYDAVYELQDLILAFGFPVNIQVVHGGTAKENFQWPKGVLRLYGAREEECVLVSKVGPDGALNLIPDSANVERFEIPVDKDLLFARGIIKKKPTIKPMLGDIGTIAASEKLAFCKPDLNELKDIPYHRSNSVNKSMNVKPKPVLAKSKSSTSFTVLMKPSSGEAPVNISSDQSHTINQIQSEKSADSTVGAGSVLLDSAEVSGKEDIELPERVPKELKKTRSSNLLDKLSVRKVKKERAKLKELKGEDVFSKRISRNDLNYQEFFNGLDEDEHVKRSDEAKAKQDDSGLGSSNGTYKSTASSNSVLATSDQIGQMTSVSPVQSNRKLNMKDRDLPPIPPESPPPHGDLCPTDVVDVTGSKESLYEHLPPAPRPPAIHRSKSSDSPFTRQYDEENGDEDDDDDGYMIPIRTPEPRYVKRSDIQLRSRPSTPHESYRGERERKSKSELYRRQPEEIDLDTLFDFTYAERRPVGAVGGMASAASTSHLYGSSQVSRWSSDLPENLEQKFVDNLDLETYQRRRRVNRKHRSRDVNSNPNATIRSHNLKKLRPTARDLFKSASTIPSLGGYDLHPTAREILQSNVNQQAEVYARPSRPVVYSSRAPAYSYPFMQPPQFHGIYGTGSQYAESEPCYRHVASSGAPETFMKQGDDSAISVGSRGDAGYLNDSEYSYNEYLPPDDEPDGWTPPVEIEGMTVQQVARALRYIGMKDRVAIRFSNEQIDGTMLCSLDDKLLKEGFPELNALEVKKILDFVRGWRPKKS